MKFPEIGFRISYDFLKKKWRLKIGIFQNLLKRIKNKLIN